MTAADASVPTAPRASAGRKRLIVTVCTMAATLMQALDNTIANVSLPHMQGSLSASADQITWVLTAYIIAAAIMTAPVGWFTNRFGRKKFFIATLVGFTVTSALCGLAQSLPEMVLFRLLQGGFGAALIPLSQTTMLDLYPPHQRGMAMALWGMGVMVGPILGPTLGGVLTDLYDWRWVFYVNLPFGILATAGLLFFLDEQPRNARLRFDWIGFAALGLALGALQLMLDRGEGKDWFGSPEIIAEAVIGGFAFYLFAVHMLTAEKPLLPPRMFRDRNFVGGLTMMLAMGLVMLSSAALLPPFLQNLGGLSVTQAGLLMAPRGFGTMAAMLIAGKLSSRVDPRLLMLFGIVLLIGTIGQMSFWTPAVSQNSILVTTIIQGFGMGFVFIPLQVAAFATLPAEYRADATSLFSLMRNIGAAIGVSLSVAVLTRSASIAHSQLAETITPFNRLLQSGTPGLILNPALPIGLAAIDGEITVQSQIIGFMSAFRFMMLTSVPALFALLLLRNAKPAARSSGPPKAAALD